VALIAGILIQPGPMSIMVAVYLMVIGILGYGDGVLRRVVGPITLAPPDLRLTLAPCRGKMASHGEAS
jgi:hypothetical protein